MNEENSNIQFKSLLAFLTESIPKFDQLSGHLRERLCRFFKEVVILPGREIIKEGALPTHACLIREGECLIMSMQNPIPSSGTHEKPVPADKGKISKESASTSQQCFLIKNLSKQVSPAKTLRGYMSLSTNTFQYRTISSKEWFGEEVLLLDEISDLKFEYSVISKTKVVILEISRENLKKFPRDITNWFRRNAKEKTIWHKYRKGELTESVGNIYNMDPRTGFLDEAFVQLKKKFPQANSQLTTQLHKQNFLTEEETVIYNAKKKKGGQRARPKSGVLPAFNNLRTLMNTKKGKVERPITAIPKTQFQGKTQTNMEFTKRLRNPPQTAPLGCKSQAQLIGGNNWLTKVSSQKRYEDIVSDLIEPQKAYLDTASTFRMSYDRKVTFPSVHPKPLQKKKPINPPAYRNNNDIEIEKMQLELNIRYDSFKVGIKDVKTVNINESKRTSSPNPVRLWAERNKIDIVKRNNEIKKRISTSQEGVIQSFGQFLTQS
eukprot:TRINITY_DN13765_c0_g1_i1.p1 TRINITY_DN13765_c0_g1~~TRINITY_DN13765_c0_g1_i1.p1  ORF type:complete len:491 (+),score=64.74 TRINITY_DN13765_c0_g1_i1:382-1854(+)